jgi:hypothetical protein
LCSKVVETSALSNWYLATIFEATRTNSEDVVG